jgi:hypothetical protein
MYVNVTLGNIIEGLTTCICCDEKDSEKYRKETKFWLEQLVNYLKLVKGEK